VADNANVPLNGAGVSGIVGNGSQNGTVKQVNDGNTEGNDTWNQGSGIKLFRNINIPTVGSGVAGDIGNGAQNQEVSQLDDMNHFGSGIGVADNANVPLNGAGVSG